MNNFIGQQVYSPGGPKLTGEVGNGLFAAGFHGDFNFQMTNLIFKESWIWESSCSDVSQKLSHFLFDILENNKIRNKEHKIRKL